VTDLHVALVGAIAIERVAAPIMPTSPESDLRIRRPRIRRVTTSGKVP
jgi:hypothetical protein